MIDVAVAKKPKTFNERMQRITRLFSVVADYRILFIGC